MRAFVVEAPFRAGVVEVDEPVAGPGEAIVEVHRAGVCGTDVAFFTGEMPLLHDGNAAFPMRIGHEWMGVVVAVADGVDDGLLGQRVTGDTMLGCQECDRCRAGYQHVCESRFEVGVRGGKAGALAERISVPAFSLHRLPDAVDDAAGALVEPAGNAIRSVIQSGVAPGERLLVIGAGSIGIVAAMYARALGIEAHLLGRSASSLDFARAVGLDLVWSQDTLPQLAWHGVVNASTDHAMPQRAVDVVEPGRKVVFLGLAGQPSIVDTRNMVFKDVTAVGMLSGSPVIETTIEAFASGLVDARPLIAATIPLDGLAAVLGGQRPSGAGAGPKIHIDPRI